MDRSYEQKTWIILFKQYHKKIETFLVAFYMELIYDIRVNTVFNL